MPFYDSTVDPLIFCDSFDHLASGQFLRKWVSGSTGIITTGRTNNGVTVTNNGSPMQLVLPRELSTLCVCMARQLNGGSSISMFEISNVRTSIPTISLNDVGDGRIQVVFGSATAIVPAFTESAGSFYHFGLYIALSTDGTTISAHVKVFINGNFTPALDTTLTQVNGSPALVADLRLTGPGTGTGNQVIDDFYITTGQYLGDVRIYVIRPNGIGNASGWTPTSPTNWQMVKDITPDDLTTINSAASGTTVEDLHNMEDISGGPVVFAQGIWCAQKSDGGVATFRGEYFKPSISATDQTSDCYISYNSFICFVAPRQNSPFTGIGWTVPEINELQQGYIRTS